MFGSHRTSGDLFEAAEFVSNLIGHTDKPDELDNSTAVSIIGPKELDTVKPKEIEKYRRPDSLFNSYKRNRKNKGIGAQNDNNYRIKYERREPQPGAQVFDEPFYKVAQSEQMDESLEQTIMQETEDDWVMRK